MADVTQRKPRLNAEAIKALREHAEAAWAMAGDKEDRQFAAALSALLDWHDEAALTRPAPSPSDVEANTPRPCDDKILHAGLKAAIYKTRTSRAKWVTDVLDDVSVTNIVLQITEGSDVLDKLIERHVLARMRGAAVPEGWKLVPVEPTPEMLEAGEDETSYPDDVYRVMLAAAPEVPR